MEGGVGLPIGLMTPLPPPPPARPIDVAALAGAAERLGFESLWCQEHIVAPVETASRSVVFTDGQVPGFTDPLIALARASAVTERIKLGTAVLLAPERNPLLLAKELATLDLFSGGRLLVGVGAGWQREESQIMGADFDHRWAQAREAVLALKALWTEDVSEFQGRYYDFPPVRSYPKPLQQPHPPIYLGGKAPNVLKRVAAWAEGWAPNFVTPEEVGEARRRLDRLAIDNGRDPDALVISPVCADADYDTARRFLDAGAVRVLVRPPVVHTEAEALATVERIAERLLK
jgi:probable F420-dependent oxidoreductase